MKLYHVYVDYRVDTNVPFYVGKGNDNRIRDFKCRNKIWHRIVDKHGVRREITLSLSDHDAILAEEIRLIRELRTRSYLGGANLTDDGEGTLGWSPSIETRQRMGAAKRGIKLTDAHRAKMSLAHIKRYESSDERKKASEHFRQIWSNESVRMKMCESRRGEKNVRAMLTETDVRELRAACRSIDLTQRGQTKKFCTEHALRLCVTPENVYGIVKGKSWKHVV